MEETLNSFQNDFFREMRQRFALFLLPYELLKERIYSCSGLKLIGLDISTFLGLKQQRGEEKKYFNTETTFKNPDFKRLYF